MLILVVVVWMLLFVCLGLNCSVVCCVGFGFALLGCVFVVLLLLLGCVSCGVCCLMSMVVWLCLL